MINLAIADDHKIFREGLKAVLGDCSELELLIEARNGRELINQLPSKNPDVILMDIKMPELDGMQATAYVRQHLPGTKVLALSMYQEDKYILDMMKAGASGYLLKDAEPKEIIEAIFTVHKKNFYFNDRLSVTLVKQLMGQSTALKKGEEEIQLNEREEDVLKLICQEYTNAEIAEKLFLSVRTVEGYRTRLLEKVGCKNIVGLVIFAIKQGIIQV